MRALERACQNIRQNPKFQLLNAVSTVSLWRLVNFLDRFESFEIPNLFFKNEYFEKILNKIHAVFGTLESFAGRYIRPSRAGCTTGASTASQKEAANGKAGRNISATHWQLYEKHLSQENASH